MSYVNLIANLVRDVLTPGGILKDIPITVTYYSGEVGNMATYDTATLTVTPNETLGTPVYAVVVSPKERQIDNVNVLANDRYFYISNVNLENAGITSIKPQDRVVVGTVSYTVMNVEADPTFSLWTLLGRLP